MFDTAVGPEAAGTRARRCRGERGETLLESLTALVVLCAIGVAAFGAFATTIRQSSSQRASAAHETLLRSVAEALQSPDNAYLPRAGCPGRTAYVVPASTTNPGYSVSVLSVSFWSGAPASPTATLSPSFTNTCPATDAADPGLQRIVLRSTGPGGVVDVLTIVKRRP